MKKLTIIITLILVFSLTFSSLAMFPDVPSDHWAYEDIQELAAEGIFEGYPDGEFKGDQALTRYEYATVVDRILETLRENLNEDVEDVKADLEGVIEEYSEGLTPEQAQEALNITEALIEELAEQEDVDQLDSELAEIQENLNKQIKKLEVDLQAQKQLSTMRYNDLVAQYEDINSQVEEDIAALQENIEELQTGLEDGEESREELSEEVASSFEELEALEAKISENVQTLKELDIDLKTQKELGTIRYDDLTETINEKYDELESVIQSDIEDLVKLEVDLKSQKQLSSMRYNDLNEKIGEIESTTSDVQDTINENVDEEIKKIDENIEGLTSDIEAVENRVAVIENQPIKFTNPKYGVNYKKLVITGPGEDDAWFDPYNINEKKPNKNQYKEDAHFNQKMGFDMQVTTQDFSADLAFNTAIENYFGGNSDWNYSDISAKIKADDFTASIDTGHAPGIRDYIFGKKGKTDGVLATIKGNTYVLGNDKSNNDESVVFAGENTLPFMGTDLNIGFGIENPVVGLEGGRNIVIGMDTIFDIAGFTFKPEFAFSDKKFEERLLTLNTTGDLGPIATEFNYTKDTGLTPIVSPKYGVTNGYDISGEMDLLNLSALYKNYAVDGGNYLPKFEFSASKEMLNINNQFNYDNFTDKDSSRLQYQADTGFNINDNLALTAKLNWLSIANDYVDYQKKYNNKYKEEEDTFDKILIIDYVLNNLETQAKYTLDIDNELFQDYWAKYTMLDGDLIASADIHINADIVQTYKVNYDPTDSLSTSATITTKKADSDGYAHLYTASYDFGLIGTAIEQYINHEDYSANEGNATVFTADFNSGKEELYTLPVVKAGISPYAEFGYQLSDENLTNYALGFDVNRTLFEGLTADGTFEWANKRFAVDIPSRRVTKEIGLDYTISDNVSASFDFTDFSVEDVDHADYDDYDVRKAVGSINVGF